MMKFMKCVLVLMIVLLTFVINTFAEETNRTLFQATMNENDVSVEEIELDGSIDNSNLQVKVVKQVGSQLTTIYTGKLGDYENGKWSNVDFTGMYFLALFDWETMENEVTYIVPIEQSVDNTSNIITAYDTVSSTSEEVITSLDTTFDFDVVFWNSSGYDEYIVENKNVLGVDLRIKNNSNLSEVVQPYFALYENGRCLKLKY